MMKELLAPLQAWWRSVTPREQKMVMGMGALTVLAIAYWGIWQPLSERTAQAQARLQTEKQLLSWVSENANDIVTLRAQGGSDAPSDQPLNQVITNSTRQFNIELIRVQPRGEMMQVWIQPLPFSQLVSWIAYLQERQGVSVDAIDIDRGKVNGVVEVKRLQLKHGG
ncbi:type II secretion system protein M [Vibrio cholerae]|nr:general secretion pathway protein M [Vibrio cholerae VL426]PNM49220.1 general secretion pathway protein GspM [Vibrio cholerae]TQO88380.1 type II secretion system protein M [Vibrio cholerae]TQP43577.1 type II secretion system protein M [Vibrio cholerae]TQP78277.1 type II secretion system protein M [Vibrio cholerae]